VDLLESRKLAKTGNVTVANFRGFDEADSPESAASEQGPQALDLAAGVNVELFEFGQVTNELDVFDALAQVDAYDAESFAVPDVSNVCERRTVLELQRREIRKATESRERLERARC
jgi:hypothetical protein